MSYCHIIVHVLMRASFMHAAALISCPNIIKNYTYMNVYQYDEERRHNFQSQPHLSGKGGGGRWLPVYENNEQCTWNCDDVCNLLRTYAQCLKH